MISVSQAVDQRRSTRAFLERRVEPELLRDILSRAGRAPSGGNLQPWIIHAVSGTSLARLKLATLAQAAAHPFGEPGGYAVYPGSLPSPYRDRRFKVGEDMYARLGIARGDRDARLSWFARNYELFGAPTGLFCFVDRIMGPPQWSDLGMYLQTVMLLAQEAGLATCAQESWSGFARTVEEALATDPALILFCGIAIGYPDPAAPVNALRSDRADPDEFLVFHD